MKKILGLFIASAIVFTMLTGCSSDKAASQKSEEEIKAELKAEMEAEEQKKKELEAEIRAELEAEQTSDQAGDVQEKQQSANVSKAQEQKKEAEQPNAQEQKKEAEQPNAQEQKKEAEQPKASAKQEPTKTAAQTTSTANPLIESAQDQGETTYYKYKANTTVKFDLNDDGTNEEIKYDSKNGKLTVKGFEAINVESMFAQKDYFIIIKFSDKFDTNMTMIGIIDYGPSNDPTTSLYAITAPQGEDWFGSAGEVPGELVPSQKYDYDNMEDFNYKAVLQKGQGIEAPVRLSVLPHATWFGRNLFTYYTTYRSLIDNIDKYGQDYATKMVLSAQKSVTGYSEKSTSSGKVTISAGSTVYALYTDNNEWIAIVTEDGIEGWFKASDVSQSNFSGFPVFD